MDYKEKIIALLDSEELSQELRGKLEGILSEFEESKDERTRKVIMITEDYCSSKVAKLLKEKGFNVPVWTCYEDEKDKNIIFGDKYNWNNSPMGQTSAPTHQMAMKWLRDVYDIHISVGKAFLINDMDDKTYLAFVCTKKCHTSYNSWQEYHRTYEEAVEAALKYCLMELL